MLTARARSRLSRLALLAVPVGGVLELVAHLVFAHRPPAYDDWFALRDLVAGARRPGDLVVVAPGWADPLARRALGDALMPLRDDARPDVSRYASALEISILGGRAPELAGWRERERRAQGKFVLRRLDNPQPADVLFDFADHVEPPFADVRLTEPAAPCAFSDHARVEAGGLGGAPTFPAHRFECPGGSFFNVGVTVIADEEFRPRRCIWSHPPQRGEVVTHFSGVPLGDVIRGHGGMYWIIERELHGAPVELVVRVDGEPVGTYVHRDGDGWSAFEFRLGAHARSPHADVEFAVRSDNYQHRHFCFEADTR